MSEHPIIPLVIFILVTVTASGDNADDGEKRRWSDEAELSYVRTGGNVESSTLGFNNAYKYEWPSSAFSFKAGGIRSETTSVTVSAVGTEEEYRIVRTENVETTAEMFYGKFKFRRDISRRLFWYAGARWERNRFSGIDNRYGGSGGVGYLWLDEKRIDFKSEYGVRIIDEGPVFQPPGFDDTYAAVTLAHDLEMKVFESSKAIQNFELVVNAEETDDFRAELLNALKTNLNSHLALKVGLDFIYDNQPAFREVVLYDENGTETGKVLYELDELDTVFTTSLVMTF